MKQPGGLSELWQEIRQRLARVNYVALLSDFDGTLAPIVPHPRQARLPAATRQALRRISRCPHTRVAIVSGRTLSDLRRLVGLRALWYVGSHGLELSPPYGRGRVLASAAERRRMAALARQLRRHLRGLRGIWVEVKPASATVHFRQATPATLRQARQRLQQAWRRQQPGIRLQEGKKVWEFLPDRDVSKAAAVARLLARFGLARFGRARWRAAHRRRNLVIFLGDDAADERVFGRLGRSAVTIAVGQRKTQARYCLAAPATVSRFLARLAGKLKCA